MNRFSALGVVSLFCALPANAEPLLTSSFDEPVVKFLAAGDVIDGWTVTGPGAGSVFLLPTTYAEPAISLFSHSGSGALDLTGPGNVGPSAGIFRDIETDIGAAYDISFFVGNATGDADGTTGNSWAYTLPSSIELLINGASVGLFTNDAITQNGVNWQQFSSRFFATGATTRVAFRNATQFDDKYAGLDDISISSGALSLAATPAVPEPATWIMMIVGFGAIGAAVRRGARPAASVRYA